MRRKPQFDQSFHRGLCARCYRTKVRDSPYRARRTSLIAGLFWITPTKDFYWRSVPRCRLRQVISNAGQVASVLAIGLLLRRRQCANCAFSTQVSAFDAVRDSTKLMTALFAEQFALSCQRARGRRPSSSTFIAAQSGQEQMFCVRAEKEISARRYQARSTHLNLGARQSAWRE